MTEIFLDCLPINSIGIVSGLDCSGSIRRRLLDLGIVQGTKIEPIFKSSSGDPTAFDVRGSTIAIRKEDASLIRVKCMFE